MPITVTGNKVHLPSSGDPAELAYWGMPSMRMEGDTLPSTTDWTIKNGTGEATAYDWSVPYSSQITVQTESGENHLRLRAERMTPITAGGKTREWKSAHMVTTGKFVQRYGRWEMQFRLANTFSHSTGLWPSFWLRDNVGGGEVDIFEAWGPPGKDPSAVTYLNENIKLSIHEDTNGGAASTTFWYLPTRPASQETPYRLSEGWHTVVCEWYPDRFDFYLDGDLKGTKTYAAFPWLATAFPGACNIRVHYAIGSSYNGIPDEMGELTKSPADYLINYIRVYEYPG